MKSFAPLNDSQIYQAARFKTNVQDNHFVGDSAWISSYLVRTVESRTTHTHRINL